MSSITPAPNRSSHVRPLPRPGRPIIERRADDRPQTAAGALYRAITVAAARGGLDAVLITDDFGMLIANSHGDLDVTELAAVTPIIGRGRASARVRRAGAFRPLTVKPVFVGGEHLYVTGVGGEFGARQREVASSIAAVRRILA